MERSSSAGDHGACGWTLRKRKNDYALPKWRAGCDLISLPGREASPLLGSTEQGAKVDVEAEKREKGVHERERESHPLEILQQYISIKISDTSSRNSKKRPNGISINDGQLSFFLSLSQRIRSMQLLLLS